MRRIALLLLYVLLFSATARTATGTSTRRIPCKTPANATSCYWTHGRLGFTNGTPALRLWKIGTHWLLDIYSGPSTYNPKSGDLFGDNENPELPPNVHQQLKSFDHRIFADFEVCPLESESTVKMQAACIESAKNIVVEK
jgi:hypothetical protein